MNSHWLHLKFSLSFHFSQFTVFDVSFSQALGLYFFFLVSALSWGWSSGCVVVLGAGLCILGVGAEFFPSHRRVSEVAVLRCLLMTWPEFLSRLLFGEVSCTWCCQQMTGARFWIQLAALVGVLTNLYSLGS